MTNTIIDIATGKPKEEPKADSAIVEFLSDLTEQARAGVIVQLAAVWESSDGMVNEDYAEGPSHSGEAALIGGLEISKFHRISNELYAEKPFA